MISLRISRLARILAGSAALTFATLGLAACGGDDDDAPATSQPTTAPAATTAAPSQTVATGAVSYPLKVTDLLGRDVTIPSKPKAVVALSPTAVEYVYAVGGTVIGRPSSALFPEEVKSVKEVGTAYQPSAEAILALKPDLIVADSIIHAQPDLRKLVEGLGVPVVFAGADSYQKVLDGILLVGKVLDQQEKAKAAAAAVTKARDDAKAAIGSAKVTAVVMISGRDQTLYSAKASSFAGDILAQLGISNPAADGPDSGPGFPGYTTVATEKLIQFNPDFIFTVTPGPASVPRLSTLIPNIPPFKGLKAVTTPNHVVELEVDPVLQAPGPRVALAFKAIAAAVSGKP